MGSRNNPIKKNSDSILLPSSAVLQMMDGALSNISLPPPPTRGLLPPCYCAMASRYKKIHNTARFWKTSIQIGSNCRWHSNAHATTLMATGHDQVGMLIAIYYSLLKDSIYLVALSGLTFHHSSQKKYQTKYQSWKLKIWSYAACELTYILPVMISSWTSFSFFESCLSFSISSLLNTQQDAKILYTSLSLHSFTDHACWLCV